MASPYRSSRDSRSHLRRRSTLDDHWAVTAGEHIGVLGPSDLRTRRGVGHSNNWDLIERSKEDLREEDKPPYTVALELAKVRRRRAMPLQGEWTFKSERRFMSDSRSGIIDETSSSVTEDHPPHQWSTGFDGPSSPASSVSPAGSFTENIDRTHTGSAAGTEPSPEDSSGCCRQHHHKTLLEKLSRFFQQPEDWRPLSSAPAPDRESRSVRLERRAVSEFDDANIVSSRVEVVDAPAVPSEPAGVVPFASCPELGRCSLDSDEASEKNSTRLMGRPYLHLHPSPKTRLRDAVSQRLKSFGRVLNRSRSSSIFTTASSEVHCLEGRERRRQNRESSQPRQPVISAMLDTTSDLSRPQSPANGRIVDPLAIAGILIATSELDRLSIAAHRKPAATVASEEIATPGSRRALSGTKAPPATPASRSEVQSSPATPSAISGVDTPYVPANTPATGMGSPATTFSPYKNHSRGRGLRSRLSEMTTPELVPEEQKPIPDSAESAPGATLPKDARRKQQELESLWPDKVVAPLRLASMSPHREVRSPDTKPDSLASPSVFRSGAASPSAKDDMAQLTEMISNAISQAVASRRLYAMAASPANSPSHGKHGVHSPGSQYFASSEPDLGHSRAGDAEAHGQESSANHLPLLGSPTNVHGDDDTSHRSTLTLLDEGSGRIGLADPEGLQRMGKVMQR